MGLILGPIRYALAPWSNITPSDLCEQGRPELVRDCRHERHIGLRVHGEYVADLGLLAVRCLRHGDDVVPMGLAIAEEPYQFPEPKPRLRFAWNDPGDSNSVEDRARD